MIDLQAARTASELALQLRKLDSHIQWEALKRPLLDADSPYASAEILERRPAVVGMGWDYLVQMPPGEGYQTLTPAVGSVGFGSAVGVRQPLQPLIPALHQVLPAQQHPMSHSKLLQQLPPSQPLQSVIPVPKPSQHAQQQQGQQQAMQVPVQPMSILPNNAAVQQQQQAASPADIKQIVVQQAISSLSGSALPQQAPLIAESARMASSAKQTQLAALSANQPDSALPNQTQASIAVNDTSHNHLNGSLTGLPPVISSQRSHPSSATAPTPSQQSAEAVSEPAAEAAQSFVPAEVTQPQKGSSVPPEQDAPQAATTEAAAEGSQHTSPPPSQTHHPAAAPTPFATQPAPKQASSLSSLVPHALHRPASAGASGQAQGQVARTLGAGPSREGTPNPKGPAKWVHESTLPLWLVKIYEEKRRRDVAMVAARAAQQAQREANRSASLLSARWNAERKLHSSPSYTVGPQGCSYGLHMCACPKPVHS